MFSGNEIGNRTSRTSRWHAIARALIGERGGRRRKLRRSWVAVATVALAASVGVVGFATPAGAHSGSISGVATCGSDGTYTIVWSGATTNVPTSGNGHTASLTVETSTSNPNTFPYQPASSTVTPLTQTVVGNTTYSFTQTNIPGSTTHAEVTPYLHWGDGATSDPLGSLTLAGNCTQQVAVPAGPTASTPTCDTAGSLTVTPPGEHVTVTGGKTGDGPGTYTITYTTKSGYTFPNGDTTKIYHITVQPKVTGDSCKTEVSPVGPTHVTQPTCDGITPVPGSFVPPSDGGGITYSVSGNVITATITDGSAHKWGNLNGYTKTSETTATYTVALGTPPTCPSGASPAAPTVTQSTCAGPGSHSQAVLHITAATGVVYKIDGNVVSGDVNVNPGDVVTVVATPAAGYLFDGDQSVSYKITFTDPGDCLVLTTPVAPTSTDAACTTPGQHSDATLVVPSTPHVVYKINGVGPDVSGQTLNETVGTSLNVVATPVAGYKFDGAQSVSYPVSFTDPGDCLVLTTPVAPTSTDAACTTPGQHSDATLVVPSTPHVVYKINGVGPDVSGQTLNETVGTSLNVVATPAAGYKFDGAQSLSYPVSFTDPGDCLVAVSPITPTLTQAVCDGPGTSTQASIDIPTVTGVIYQIGGADVSGSVPVTGPAIVIVTAIAAPGYQLATDAVSSWTLEFTDAGGCLVGVLVAAPSFTDDVCSAGHPADAASYVIPATPHVTYTVDGTTVPAGTYPATDGSTVTIVAVADSGYSLTGTATFTHTFPVPTCLTSVIATEPSFVSDVCTAAGQLTGASYTIPETTGVGYAVDGETAASGTYQAKDGSTITIVATATDGYTLTGTTQWTHTFAAKPECLGTAGESSSNPGTPTPAASHGTAGVTATTGVEVAWMLTAGIAFLLVGGAALVLAATRRRGHHVS